MGSALGKNGGTRKWRKLRAAILRRDNHTCYHCGAPANTVDHLVPRELGGDDNPANLAAACGTCNYRRGGQLTQAKRKGQLSGPGATPERLSLSRIPPNTPGGYTYSVSNRQERKKRDGE